MRLDHKAIERTCAQLGRDADEFKAVYDQHLDVERLRAERAKKAPKKAEPKASADSGQS